MSEAALSGFDCVEHLGTSDNLWIECSRDADRLWHEKDKSTAIPAWIGQTGGDLLIAFALNTIIKNSLKISPKDLDILERALSAGGTLSPRQSLPRVTKLAGRPLPPVSLLAHDTNRGPCETLNPPFALNCRFPDLR